MLDSMEKKIIDLEIRFNEEKKKNKINFDSVSNQLVFWKTVSIVSILVIFGLFFYAQPILVSAEDNSHGNIVMRDSNGKARMSFVVEQDGSPTFRMLDAQGKVKLVLGVTSKGCPNILLRDNNDKTRLTMYVSPDNVPNISMYDRNEKARLSTGVGPKDSSEFMLMDDTGRYRIGMTAAPEGIPSLLLRGSSGKGGVVLKVQSDNSSFMSFFDDLGKPTWMVKPSSNKK
jgi:hypothetical protein